MLIMEEKKEKKPKTKLKQVVCKGLVRLGSNKDGSPKLKGGYGDTIEVTPEQEKSLKNKNLI